MKTAFVFPGQGAQFTGMGKELYENSPKAKKLMDIANQIVGFSLTDIMFSGSEEDLKQTKVTQPAVFLHSVALFFSQEKRPDMTAGHSLGEFSALVAAGALSFEDAMKLVYQRAMAMQKACEINPSTMAAVLGMEDSAVESVLKDISEEIVVPANYNSPGQLVISGSHKGIEIAMEKLKQAGAKRVLPLQVGGAFHSPLMEPAREELAKAIEETSFNQPICPVYQNVDAKPSTEISVIKQKLISQLTASVRWTQSVENMVADGATLFYECGPGKVLQGLIKKINKDSEAVSV